MLGVMLMGGALAAQSVTITNPSNGDFLSGDVAITWDAVNLSEIDIYFMEGISDCSDTDLWDLTLSNRLVSSLPVGEDSFLWDTELVSDSDEYCLRISKANGALGFTQEDFVGHFTIDNTAPEAQNGGPYTCNEGDSILLNASESKDDLSGIDSSTYKWYVDGVSIGGGETRSYYCEDGDAVLEVYVTVEDLAGNADASTTSTITVSNVAPTSCDFVATSGLWDVASNNEIEFTGIATDVAADTLEYSWYFGDGDTSSNENPSAHSYDSEGVYTVELTVSDGDGGSCTATHDVDVVEPTLADDQEIAAYYDLDYSFDSLLTSLVDCEDVYGMLQSGMSLGESGDSCTFDWTQPTNNQQGHHSMVVRVNNGTDYGYFSFTTTVYSWMIPLEDGWNLFSIPLVSEASSVEGWLFDDSVSGMNADLYDYFPGSTEYILYSYQYDSSAGESSWLSSRRTGYGDLDEILPGYAYWLKVDNPNDDEIYLKGFGTQTGTGVPGLPPETEVLTNHWSLIGKYGILGETFEEDGTGEDGWWRNKIDALNTLVVSSSELNVYRIFDAGNGLMQLDSVDNLYNNHGYWLFLEDNAGFGSETATYTPAGDSFYSQN